MTGHGSKTALRRLAAAATLCAAIFSPAAIATAQTAALPSTCNIVAAYEAEHDHAFIDVFDAMVFTGNERMWEDGSVAPCAYEKLRRWSGAFDLFIPRLHSWGDGAEHAKPMLRTLDPTLGLVLSSLGLTMQDIGMRSRLRDVKRQNIAVILGTQSEIFNFAELIDSQLPGSQIERHGRTIASRGPNCWNQTFAVDGGGATKRGLVFVDVDLPPEQAASCMKEQIFKIFVPGNPPGAGFFDDGWRPMEDGAPGAKYSLRDVAVVNLLHNEALTPGMPRADALAEAMRILAACP